MVIAIATGLYSVAPSVAYPAIVLACGLLFADRRFARSPLKFIEARKFLGFAMFNVFFWARSLFSSLEPRTYFLTLVSLGIFLLVYGYSRLTLLDRVSSQADHSDAPFELISIGALATLLLGQVAEILGYIDRRDLGLEPDVIVLDRRPGGFLNPNMTAAISLVLLFVMDRCSRTRWRPHLILGLVLTVSIVLLSQSRMGILVLSALSFVLIARRGLVSLALSSVLLILLAFFIASAQDEVIRRLIDATVSRFGEDGSSEERAYVMTYGLSAFADAPLLGNGYRFLVSVLGYSAHNEVVENLVNFGLLGTLIVLAAAYQLYMPASPTFLLVCALPTFAFTHNFFETTAFQASLGFALAIDTLRSPATAPRGGAEFRGLNCNMKEQP